MISLEKQAGTLCQIMTMSAICGLAGCSDVAKLNVADGTGPAPTLPAPSGGFIPQVNAAKAVGWPDDRNPNAAQGLSVQAFAQGLDHPRWLYTLPNGDVLVAETNAPKRPQDGDGIKGWAMGLVMKKAGAATPSANRITLLRDTDGDGISDQRSIFIEGLHSPFGMALVGDRFYVANTDAVVEFPYHDGDLQITETGKILAPLSGGPLNHHWTKSLIASKDGKRLYVGVGSNSNVAENGIDKEENRAEILEIQIDTGQTRSYANGLRNPVGLSWVEPTGQLWVSVNERDEIGGDLVPDYMTSVKDGGFYGWPYSYYGAHVDTRVEPQRPDLVAKAIVPDYALGPHTASLGLLYVGDSPLLPTKYSNGMFIGQHGSWNRKPKSGYKVIFVDFIDGKPNGQPRDVLSGFLDSKEDKAYGRPVGLTLGSDGALLVADDVGNTIWRVAQGEK